MVKTKVRTAGLWLLLALLLSACQPIQAPTKPQGAQRAPRPDAPPYAVHGPFAVGYKSLVIGEEPHIRWKGASGIRRSIQRAARKK